MRITAAIAEAVAGDRVLRIFFFFQAEDGIRDLTVTGVQTCALPIWSPLLEKVCWHGAVKIPPKQFWLGNRFYLVRTWRISRFWRIPLSHRAERQIGRASCRERG